MSQQVENLSPGSGGSQDQASPGPQGVLAVESTAGVRDVEALLDGVLVEVKTLFERVSGLEEKSGVFKDDLGSLRKELEDLRARLGEVHKDLLLVRRESTISRLAGVVGLWKLHMCSNNSQGICTAWRINSDAELKAIYGDQAVVDVEGVKRARVSIAYHLCSFCPLFRPRG
jgi:hypothetical protein